MTLLFWATKICATALGKTAGDQLAARCYIPALYWAVILAASTAGAIMSDYMDRTAGRQWCKAQAVAVGLGGGTLIEAVEQVWQQLLADAQSGSAGFQRVAAAGGRGPAQHVNLPARPVLSDGVAHQVDF